MAFGKRKSNDNIGEQTVEQQAESVEPDDAELEGPFDLDDFDDPSVAAVARLDLGSVLIPIPETGQVQVELNQAGAPSAVWVVTANGRFTIAAYAAPKSAGLWREVAGELADSLRKDASGVRIEDGPWGREVIGAAPAQTNQPVETNQPEQSTLVRFIGVDGYRWMIRCVVNGPAAKVDALADEARNALADTVVRRGDTPLPVRTPLPVELPEPMAAQLRAAAEQQGQQQPAEQPPEPAARRSAQGTAMQQMQQIRSSITGG